VRGGGRAGGDSHERLRPGCFAPRAGRSPIAGPRSSGPRRCGMRTNATTSSWAPRGRCADAARAR
jgi:hypothetical protein